MVMKLTLLHLPIYWIVLTNDKPMILDKSPHASRDQYSMLSKEYHTLYMSCMHIQSDGLLGPK